jgi:hypothetical protein
MPLIRITTARSILPIHIWVLVSTLLHAAVYDFLHNLLNELVQIANKTWLQKKIIFCDYLVTTRSRTLFWMISNAINDGFCEINHSHLELEFPQIAPKHIPCQQWKCKRSRLQSRQKYGCLFLSTALFVTNTNGPIRLEWKDFSALFIGLKICLFYSTLSTSISSLFLSLFLFVIASVFHFLFVLLTCLCLLFVYIRRYSNQVAWVLKSCFQRRH